MQGNNYILATEDLSIGYLARLGAEEKRLFEHIELQIKAGEMVGLLGPNGAGKSTLLRTLAGFHVALSGKVLLEGKPLQTIQPVERSKKISVVLTGHAAIQHLKVEEVVMLGRHPHTNWLGSLTEADTEAIKTSVQQTGIEEFLHRQMDELSDGERQKVMIARALAQDTNVILLDEPAMHLDLANKAEIYRLLKQMTSKAGKALIIATHEVDMALHACDKLILVNKNNQKLSFGKITDPPIAEELNSIFAGEHIKFNRENLSFDYDWSF